MRSIPKLIVFLLLLPVIIQLIGELRSSFSAKTDATTQCDLTPEWNNPYHATQAKWLISNFHTHSSVLEGEIPPAQLAQEYRKRGFDVLAITDHQWIAQVKDVPDGLVLIPGYEHGANISKVHFGVLDPRGYDWDWFPLRQSLRHLEWTSNRLSAHNRLVVLNHPGCTLNEPLRLEHLQAMPSIRMIELSSSWDCGNPNFGSMDLWDAAWREGRNLWALGGDDAHRIETIGDSFTLVASDRSVESVLQSLGTGKTIAVHGKKPANIVRPIRAELRDAEWILELERPVDRIFLFGPNRQQWIEVNRTSVLKFPHTRVEQSPFFRLEYHHEGIRYFLNPISKRPRC